MESSGLAKLKAAQAGGGKKKGRSKSKSRSKSPRGKAKGEWGTWWTGGAPGKGMAYTGYKGHPPEEE